MTKEPPRIARIDRKIWLTFFLGIFLLVPSMLPACESERDDSVCQEGLNELWSCISQCSTTEYGPLCEFGCRDYIGSQYSECTLFLL